MGGKWPYSWCLVGCCRQDVEEKIWSIIEKIQNYWELKIFENSAKDDILVWFLYLMAYQLFLGYLMPKSFSSKNSSRTI